MIYVRHLLQSLIQNSQKTKENILAFTCGDLFLFIHFGLPPKFMSTLLLAFLGGALGMFGKDFYVAVIKPSFLWTWRKIKRLFKKTK